MRVAGIAALVGLIGIGFSAHAGRASSDQLAKPDPAPVTLGIEADEHFPGAAAILAIAESAAPAPGVTGTTQLPELPTGIAVQALAGDASITPARPFRLRGSATDAMRAIECLTTAIYYEAASEPDNGQRAVAQVILNRVRHPAFPATVCGVIYQGSDKRYCQFSYACDGAMARRPQPAAWARARRVAVDALYGSVFAPVGLATHYHTYAVTPSWNRSLVMTAVEGAHFFHRWKGWWGTAAAFRDRYAGGEPVPGPLRAVAAPDAVIAAVTAPTPQTAAPVIDLSPAQPGYADSGAAQPAAPTDTLPPASQILDKWKDSGKPLL
ncbi:cell wall hydrolase [Sphingomonas japonica]|uniref:Spore germination cell wall hydrolase CwlJ-like protein n=1 Tax=Sphingomonas japonica TaxID=511662 RepID=A0ABX0TZF2_9SPHN|nr:cell wall hydrolase [Sphingomonas japonica]NIJ23215.1 spore germination cell wall hydrolase CwlJ-like protein [Sphingomonas japonica]